MNRQIVDTVLPTSMVGSYPRPRWYDYQLHGQHLMDAFKLEEHREAYEDATLAVIRDQEDAGLEFVTDGQMYYDDYGAGIGSLLWFWYERIPGFERHRRANPLTLGPQSADWAEVAALRQVGGTAVTSKVRPPEGGSGLVEMYRIASERATRPLKYGVGALPGNLTFHVNFDDPDSAYRSARELAEDLVPIFHDELAALVAAGCQYIQLDDLSAWLLLRGPEYHWVVDVLNAIVEGIDAKIGWHCCLGAAYGNSVREFEGQLAHIIDAMYEVNVDQYVLDFALRDMQDVGCLSDLPPDKEVAVGVIDVRTLQIESEAEVVERMRKALEVVPVDRLSFTTDCGMKALHRFNALGKLHTLARAAQTVRDELAVGSVTA